MRFSERVTLLGASKVNQRVLTEVLTFAPRLIAADGGAGNAVKLGQMPQFVIGDLDSVDPETLSSFPAERQIRIPEQDSTDLEKCLNLIDAPMILGVGFLGRRVDHQLAAFNALLQHAPRAILLISKHDLCFHLPLKLDLNLEIGTRLSLFPMLPVTGRSSGLRWPIDGIQFAPDGRIGTSNIVSQERVSLNMDELGMLAIMPREALREVVRALGK